MNKRALKERFFEKGAAALKRTISINQDLYCCPLCLNAFGFKAVEDGTLTLEHAPPESVGGKPLALTCKSCNSTTGYTIDAAVDRREKMLNAIKAITGQNSKYRERTVLEIDGVSINMEFITDEKGQSYKPINEINDPRNLELYKSYLRKISDEGRWDGQEFTVKIQSKFNIRHSEIGDLKTAFIICFALFGYRYILNRNLTPVREQILDYQSNVIDGFWVAPDMRIKKKYFVCFLDRPISAIAVRLDRSIVILPSIDSPKNLYDNIINNVKAGNNIWFKGHTLKWPTQLEMGMDFI